MAPRSPCIAARWCLLALGMALSFVAFGLFIATVGFAIGFDGDALRWVSALLLGAFGLVLLLSDLQTVFARAAAPAGQRRATRCWPGWRRPGRVGNSCLA